MHNERTREYVDVMNGLKCEIDSDVLNAMGVDVARFETLRMHEVYAVLHRRHPEYALKKACKDLCWPFSTARTGMCCTKAAGQTRVICLRAMCLPMPKPWSRYRP